MPRREPSREVTITIPLTVIDQVDLLLVDDFSGRPRYGERSKLVTRLLEEWLAAAVESHPLQPLL